jgi:hypothetical protein
MRGDLFRATVSILCLFLAAGSAAHAFDMAEGEWEIVSETSMEARGFSLPPQTSRSTQCLTREDAVPSREKDCKVTGKKIAGNTISWRMVCGKTEGEGEITYHASGKSYQGNMRMKTVEDGETATMRMKLSGNYLGPCPAGQRSGPTGETAARKAQAEQAIAQAEKTKAEQEALRKQCEEFIQRTIVPAEEPGAYTQEGYSKTPEGEQKVGSLNLQVGLYEITVEEASRIGPSCVKQQENRESGEKPKTVCLNEDNPVPYELRTGSQVRQVKRGKERITWKESSAREEVRGGVVYRGNSFDGVVTKKSVLPTGQETLQVTKVTGRRVGDGDCQKGREGRAYTSMPRSGAETSPADKEKPSDDGKESGGINPVKEIRKLFKF